MLLRLQRNTPQGEAIHGKLFVDGQYFCDTVYVQPTIPPDKPIPRFYKDCTKGFWILLIVLIGGSALRLTKLIYRHR